MNKQFPYFRFNVERDIGDIGFGDWKMQEITAAHTAAYMEEQEAEERKATCVKYLMSNSDMAGDLTSSLQGNNPLSCLSTSNVDRSEFAVKRWQCV
jgi:hypothetical protein